MTRRTLIDAESAALIDLHVDGVGIDAHESRSGGRRGAVA